MKIYYLNDTYEHVDVYTNDLRGNPKGLDPATGDYFEVDLKENQVPFIKMWEVGNILISGIDND